MPCVRPVNSAITAFGGDAAGKHMGVVAIAGDRLVARLDGAGHADDDRFLADIEVAETADEAHAVHLAGLFLKTADQQHLAIGGEFVVEGELCQPRIGKADVAQAGRVRRSRAVSLAPGCRRHRVSSGSLGKQRSRLGASVRSVRFSRLFYSNDAPKSIEQKCKSGARKMRATDAFVRVRESRRLAERQRRA